MTLTPLFIPSPSQGVWDIGPLPVRAYALCIIAGVVAAIWLTERRFVARGGRTGEVSDIAIWAVPFGLVGGRLYHVITDHDLYFGAGRRPIEALYIWNGGLGIWGAIALGALGAWIGARRRGIRLGVLADAMGPGLLLAQAIGRFGNYFNQELFGKPTTLPWGLEISPENRPPGFGEFATFHPTFLYEAVWNVLGMALIIWLDKRFKLGHGRVFALYVMVYTAGRSWIEMLRIDTIELDDVLGLRWGVWMSIILFVLALGYFVRAGRHGGREASPYDDERRAAWLAKTEPPTTTDEEPVPVGTKDRGPADEAEGSSEPRPGTSTRDRADDD